MMRGLTRGVLLIMCLIMTACSTQTALRDECEKSMKGL